MKSVSIITGNESKLLGNAPLLTIRDFPGYVIVSYGDLGNLGCNCVWRTRMDLPPEEIEARASADHENRVEASASDFRSCPRCFGRGTLTGSLRKCTLCDGRGRV
jgi:hypothetical protein